MIFLLNSLNNINEIFYNHLYLFAKNALILILMLLSKYLLINKDGKNALYII